MTSRPSLKAVALSGLVSGLVFGILAVQLKSGNSIAWDQPIVGHLEDRLPYAHDLIWPTILAGPIAGAIVALESLRRGEASASLLWMLAIGGMVILDPLLKAAIARPAINPGSSGYSFPSGSAMVLLASALAFVATVPIARRLLVTLALAAMVILQAAMLVSIGWHYPSDVLAGWAVSVAWVAVVLLGIRLNSRKRSLREEIADEPLS